MSLPAHRWHRQSVDRDPRTGLALALTGTLLRVGNWFLLRFHTNDLKWSSVLRVFVGGRMVIHGFVISAALTAFFAFLFSASDSPQRMRGVSHSLAALIVWGVSFVAHIVVIFAYLRQPVIPGETTRCRDCGVDFRDALASSFHECQICSAAIPMDIRRRFSIISPKSTEFNPEATTPPTDGPA